MKGHRSFLRSTAYDPFGIILRRNMISTTCAYPRRTKTPWSQFRKGSCTRFGSYPPLRFGTSAKGTDLLRRPLRAGSNRRAHENRRWDCSLRTVAPTRTPSFPKTMAVHVLCRSIWHSKASPKSADLLRRPLRGGHPRHWPHD